jgi:hypothetical protein
MHINTLSSYKLNLLLSATFFIWTANLLRSLSELLHFREITQPFLPALNPQLNARLIEIGPAISRSSERSDPDNDRSILHKSTTHSSGHYQNFLHNNQSTSALAAEIVLDIFAAGTSLIVLSRFALRVLE